MTNLEKNIKHYMDKKGIRMYTHLLVMIANELGYKDNDAYIFVEKEKANFSNMLKGNRPLKYEFIKPLEKIFGVSLSKLEDPKAYKSPIDKSLIPFEMGFRYYAYLDIDDLYTSNLDKLLTKEGESILKEKDEFNKSFLDYVVEYESINGIRYLRNRYNLRLRSKENRFETNPKGMFEDFRNALELARVIVNNEDFELLFDIFDAYYMYALGSYYFKESIFDNFEFIEMLLDSKGGVKYLFDKKHYKFNLSRTERRISGIALEEVNMINPVINSLLSYALDNLDLYKTKAAEILKFGIKHNKEVLSKVKDKSNYYVDKLGGLKNKDNKSELIDILVKVEGSHFGDKEIDQLVAQLS